MGGGKGKGKDRMRVEFKGWEWERMGGELMEREYKSINWEES